MYLLTYPAEQYDENNINEKIIMQLIAKHQEKVVSVIKKDMDYYEGKHAILSRAKKKGACNNKVLINHAKDIADTSTGYFLSSAITFTTNDKEMNLDALTDAFDIGDVDEVDHDNALDMARCGCAYEYVYAKRDKAVPTSRNLDPRNTFIVYDDTIEQNPLFGVYYYTKKDDSKDKKKYCVTIGTEHYIHTLTIMGEEDITAERISAEKHFFGCVPIIMYQNNKDCIGDYEQQISLIDAYNTLTSDRVNDKEQFLESILVLYGTILGDGGEESSEAMKALKEMGLLELENGTKAEYITRTFDESGMEILRKAIKEDIYNMSHVPCLSDQNFVGNSSGVAMEYKLLGLEMITKTKSRYYTKGLKHRITLYCNYLNMKAMALNPSAIIPSFKRGLPKNLLELSQMIANLKGFVSQKTLISQLDFVEDPDGEVKAVQKENQEAIKLQQESFSMNINSKPEEEKPEDEEVLGKA